MREVIIWTDGACSGNPGPGGYAGIVMCDGKGKNVFGARADTTNNRMEIMAVIKSLEILKRKCNVILHSDSAYVCNAINNKWLETWQLHSWKNSDKKPVLNRDLWEQLLELLNKQNVQFVKVKGHSDNKFNNECDEMARNAISTMQEKSIDFFDKIEERIMNKNF
jgi:ribonuclease HI